MQLLKTQGLGSQPPSGLVGKFVNSAKDYLDHVRLFSRNARLYLLGSFLLGLNFQIFQLLLNLYLKEYGFAEGNIGLILSSRALGMTLMAIPAALVLSRVRLKPVLLTSCSAFALFSFMIVSYQTFWLMSGFMLLSGMSFAFYRIAAAPFFMRNSTPTERTYLFSFSFGMMLLAGMVGSASAGRLSTILTEYTGDIMVGYQLTLYAGIAVGLLSLIPFGLIRSKKPTTDELKMKFSLDQFKRRGGFYFRISISNFLVGLGAGLIIPFLNLFFRDRFHLEAQTIGWYYFLVHMSMFIGVLAGPVLVKKMGLVRTVIVTQVISVPFMLILSYSHVLPIAVAAFVLRGGLMNLGVPIVTNLGMELSSRDEQALVNALLTVAWTSSWMISSAFGGAVIERFGYTVALNISSAVYLLSSLTFYYFFRNVEAKSDGTANWAIIRENYS